MGSLEARRVAEGDRTSFWQAVIVDLFFGGSAWWDSSCPAASVQAGLDARGTRGDSGWCSDRYQPAGDLPTNRCRMMLPRRQDPQLRGVWIRGGSRKAGLLQPVSRCVRDRPKRAKQPEARRAGPPALRLEVMLCAQDRSLLCPPATYFDQAGPAVD